MDGLRLLTVRPIYWLHSNYISNVNSLFSFLSYYQSICLILCFSFSTKHQRVRFGTAVIVSNKRLQDLRRSKRKTICIEIQLIRRLTDRKHCRLTTFMTANILRLSVTFSFITTCTADANLSILFYYLPYYEAVGKVYSPLLKFLTISISGAYIVDSPNVALLMFLFP